MKLLSRSACCRTAHGHNLDMDSALSKAGKNESSRRMMGLGIAGPPLIGEGVT